MNLKELILIDHSFDIIFDILKIIFVERIIFDDFDDLLSLIIGCGYSKF